MITFELVVLLHLHMRARLCDARRALAPVFCLPRLALITLQATTCCPGS